MGHFIPANPSFSSRRVELNRIYSSHRDVLLHPRKHFSTIINEIYVPSVSVYSASCCFGKNIYRGCRSGSQLTRLFIYSQHHPFKPPSRMPLHPIIDDNPASCRRSASAVRPKVFAHFPVNCCLIWHRIVPHHLAC